MAFGTLEKRETWVFRRERQDEKNNWLMTRCGYNLVSYDGDPDRFIEPVPEALTVDGISIDPTLIRPGIDTAVIDGFEFVTGRPFPAQAMPGDNYQPE